MEINQTKVVVVGYRRND